MKHRMNRAFWTEAGRRLLEEAPGELPVGLPDAMKHALEKLPPLPGDSLVFPGEGQQGKRSRHIYNVTWRILRDRGFQRPLRLKVMENIDILLPFFRGTQAVVPQGFQSRVPGDLRAFALVGKSAVLRSMGYHLVVCSAVVHSEAWQILKAGKCSVCTPDRLAELLNTLDFSH